MLMQNGRAGSKHEEFLSEVFIAQGHKFKIVFETLGKDRQVAAWGRLLSKEMTNLAHKIRMAADRVLHQERTTTLWMFLRSPATSLLNSREGRPTSWISRMLRSRLRAKAGLWLPNAEALRL
jgi:hypothetical protein